ncbi:galectin-5-like isoform X2 [Mercenaria mercenaria]|uniref:galectin-5-like isoform X2 n=1 Tax=Mercenaria mercenaria TaxID=6596 RepID=UPI001E1D5128|nr:galectin-5-like isoform X2 [Mercenaria mercenaria]
MAHPVPFVYNFGQLTTGKLVKIDGVSHANPSRFTIYIQQGGDREPHEIGMCFDARFKFNADKHVIVRNHKQGGWGTEERDIPFFPFHEGKPFSITILFQQNCFKVTVNNTDFLEFSHRFRPMEYQNTVRIDGDVQLSQVVILQRISYGQQETSTVYGECV